MASQAAAPASKTPAAPAAAKPAVTKVGGGAPVTPANTTTAPATPEGGAPVAAPAAVRRGPVGPTRTAFDLKTAVDSAGASAINADGKLIAPPVNFDGNKHETLKQDVFVSEPIFLRHKANVADKWAKRYADSAADYRSQADRLEKFGGKTEDIKKLSKLEKMRKEFAALKAQMLADGIDEKDIPSLDGN